MQEKDAGSDQSDTAGKADESQMSHVTFNEFLSIKTLWKPWQMENDAWSTAGVGG